MQRMKKGWQEPIVCINESSDFLNWADNVDALFGASEPIEISSANSVLRNVLVVMRASCIRSALKESRFLLRNPWVS